MATVTVELDVIRLGDAIENPVRSRHVDNLQGLLTAAANSADDPDFDPQGIDGVAGRNTRRALRLFKEKNDLTSGGRHEVDERTWERLIEFPGR